MKHIQTTISEDDFLRLKGLCIVTGTSLKQTLRDAMLHYLNENQNSFNKGEVENGREKIDEKN